MYWHYKKKHPAEIKERHILRFLLESGGKATTTEIAEALKMPVNNVRICCYRLKYKELLNRKTKCIRNKEKRPYFKRVTTYSLSEAKSERINQLVREMDA